MYGYRLPIPFRDNQINLQTFISYTFFRYWGFKNRKQIFIIKSLYWFIRVSVDINFTETFKMNFGFYVGYNTLVNDLGERNISYSIVFGTNF